MSASGLHHLKHANRSHTTEVEDEPGAFDNKGRLARAPTPEIRQWIIDGRIRHLETEIRNFARAQDQINKLMEGEL